MRRLRYVLGWLAIDRPLWLDARSEAAVLLSTQPRNSSCDIPYDFSKNGVITIDLVPLVTSQQALLGLGEFDRERGGVDGGHGCV